MQTQQTMHVDIERITVSPRRERFFMRRGKWFFLTRNEVEHGPYASLDDAKRQLTAYLHKAGVVQFSL